MDNNYNNKNPNKHSHKQPGLKVTSDYNEKVTNIKEIFEDKLMDMFNQLNQDDIKSHFVEIFKKYNNDSKMNIHQEQFNTIIDKFTDKDIELLKSQFKKQFRHILQFLEGLINNESIGNDNIITIKKEAINYDLDKKTNEMIEGMKDLVIKYNGTKDKMKQLCEDITCEYLKSRE